MKTKITFKIQILAITFMLIAISTSAQWTPVNNGLPSKNVTGVANVLDTLFTAVKGHGLYYSVNNGDNWNEWNKNNRLQNKDITKLQSLAIVPQNGVQKFFIIYGPSMLHFYLSDTDGNGNSGSKLINFSIPNSDINFAIPNETINSYLFNEKDNVESKYIATNNGVYYSINGQNWTASSGFSGDALVVNDITLAEYDDDSEAILASTNKGVYKSTDKGVSFSLFTKGIIEDIIVYNQDLFTTTSNGMYVYNTDDDKYTPYITSGDFRNSLLDYSTLTGYLFGNGVVKKMNLQTAVIEDVPQTNLTGGIIKGSTMVKDYLYVHTETGGVFRMPKNGSLKVKSEEFLENAFSTYPNPTNGNFTIKTKEPATFQLYSIKGKIIKTFNVKTELSNSMKLSSGIYFLKKKGTQSVKKIIFQ
jgi:hypothetical protein